MNKYLLYNESMTIGEPTFEPNVPHTSTSTPESQLSSEAQRYVVPTVREAFGQALYGEGLAIVEHLGVPEEIREKVHQLILRSKYDDQGRSPGLIRYYMEFDPIDMYPITNRIFNAEPLPVLYDIALVNQQYLVYLLGGSIPPHYDFGVKDEPFNQYFDERAITILYVTKGTKQLEVWPEGEDEKDGKRGVLIDQSPDMLICLRGGAIMHAGVLRPAIRHAVPETIAESAVLTFDMAAPEELRDSV